MAGPVRQPIDLKNLDKYITENVPEIALPVELKQVMKKNTYLEFY